MSTLAIPRPLEKYQRQPVSNINRDNWCWKRDRFPKMSKARWHVARWNEEQCLLQTMHVVQNVMEWIRRYDSLFFWQWERERESTHRGIPALCTQCPH